MVRIYRRSEWGAKYDNGFGPAPLPAKEVWLHHSVTAHLAVNATLASEIQQMQAIEQIGEDRFGGGISYTWLVFPSGRIFEGHSVNREGSHTAGRNSIARGLCLAGNYEVYYMTSQQIVSCKSLLVHAYNNKWITSPNLNGGHRDLKQTACPGRLAYAKIPAINSYKEPVESEDDDVKPRICRDNQQRDGHKGIHAVTQFGHWQLPSQSELENYAAKWGIPATPEPNDEVGWWGPDLTNLV